MATAWNFHELYMWHDTGRAALLFPPGLTIEPGEHAENSLTKVRFRNLVEVAGLLEDLVHYKSTPFDVEDLARFHYRDYIARIQAESKARGGDASEFTPFGPGSYEIACLAAGGTYAVTEAVLTGKAKNGYALVRPPGHHAQREYGMGFCLFANVALSVMKARVEHGITRAAVVDWDVHHGNGTEQAFYEDPGVLTISLHQDRLYPAATGKIGDRGAGAGLNTNINIPLPAGSGHGAYLAAFERIVLPALYAYKPEIIMVASGFDGSALDPLGRMMIHSETYRAMTRMLMQAAGDLCGGRLAMSHEGGYSASYVPYCGLAVMEELSGIKTAVDDPFLPMVSNYGGQELQPHQADVIGVVAEGVEGLVATA